MTLADRLGTAVTDNAGAIVAATLVVTVLLGAGIGSIEESTSVGGLAGDSAVTAAYDEVRANFSARDADTTTTLIAVETDGNALSKGSLLRTLRFQRAVRTGDQFADTLAERRPTTGVANVVARAAIERRGEDGSNASGSSVGEPPGIDEQIHALSAMDEREVSTLVERVLGSDSRAGRTARRLLPREYDPGSASATARMVVVTQETDGVVRAAPGISEAVSSDQRAIRSLAKDQAGPETYRVYSTGLLSSQQSRAISDSLGILGPLALLFVLVSLYAAYRDPVDVVLGLVGVVTVLVWTMGSLGWLGIDFGQTMIAVPILLIGLSVDYALHVIVRYREERAADVDRDAPTAMARALSGVGPALVLVTATTAIGFLANLTSPVASIQSFGLVTAIGIVATLVVYGLFVPALKTLTEGVLHRRGYDCTPSPPGAGGTSRRVLGVGATVARRAPLAMLALAVVVGAAGAYGATQVDVSSSQELFMADDPPEWTEELPAAVRPGDYFLKENRRAIQSTFQTPNRQGHVLVEGDVTDPDTLDGVRDATRVAAESGAAFELTGGEPAVVTPASAIRRAAQRDEGFAATVAATDTDGDGLPDRELGRVYDALYATAPDLATPVVHRTDAGEYDAVRIRVALEGDVDPGRATAVLSEAAAAVEAGGDLTATATGQPVVTKSVDDRLSSTMLQGLGITLVVVLALLVVVFRIAEGSATLGALTLAPVALSVCWLLGTMALLSVPISVITALVGSIAVGLGVDYAIHVTERFGQEVSAGADTATALERTVTGTGGALLSSAVTTAAGFGVLAFSFLPGLRQFGLVLALGIVYAFLASVYVQPSLLALWGRLRGRSTVACDAAATPADD